jgi:hypothetical protein
LGPSIQARLERSLNALIERSLGGGKGGHPIGPASAVRTFDLLSLWLILIDTLNANFSENPVVLRADRAWCYMIVNTFTFLTSCPFNFFIDRPDARFSTDFWMGFYGDWSLLGILVCFIGQIKNLGFLIP